MKKLLLLALIACAPCFAADMYAYVDPVSGNNGTAVISATPATAAALPYATLVAAEAAGRQNLTTMAGDFHFRLLQGVESTTAVFVISSATWPGSTPTRRLIFEGFGTGIHDGTFATTTGYTFSNTVASSVVFDIQDVHTIMRDFRIRRTQFGTLIDQGSSSFSKVLDRMILDNADGEVWKPQINSTGATALMQNCAVINRSGRAISAFTADDLVTLLNNTIIGNHATNPVVDANATRIIASWNYVHNIGGGPAYGGSSWATSTRDKNASSDTTGDSTYQSIAYATGSGARFTSLTANAENYDIGSASTLKNLATDSSLTIDIKSRSRSTPDIGAFEEQTAGGGTGLIKKRRKH